MVLKNYLATIDRTFVSDKCSIRFQWWLKVRSHDFNDRHVNVSLTFIREKQPKRSH